MVANHFLSRVLVVGFKHFLFSISYMGYIWDNPFHWRTHIFFRMIKSTNCCVDSMRFSVRSWTRICCWKNGWIHLKTFRLIIVPFPMTDPWCWYIYIYIYVYMLTWIPSIYPSHVSIYTSTMDLSWVLFPWGHRPRWLAPPEGLHKYPDCNPSDYPNVPVSATMNSRN